eukprot:6747570-Prymnesium_polylepis.1
MSHVTVLPSAPRGTTLTRQTCSACAQGGAGILDGLSHLRLQRATGRAARAAPNGQRAPMARPTARVRRRARPLRARRSAQHGSRASRRSTRPTRGPRAVYARPTRGASTAHVAARGPR